MYSKSLPLRNSLPLLLWIVASANAVLAQQVQASCLYPESPCAVVDAKVAETTHMGVDIVWSAGDACHAGNLRRDMFFAHIRETSRMISYADAESYVPNEEVLCETELEGPSVVYACRGLKPDMNYEAVLAGPKCSNVTIRFKTKTDEKMKEFADRMPIVLRDRELSRNRVVGTRSKTDNGADKSSRDQKISGRQSQVHKPHMSQKYDLNNITGLMHGPVSALGPHFFDTTLGTTGCIRPTTYCTGTGKTFKNVDCDGDGLLDLWCEDAVTKIFTADLSSLGCVTVPKASYVDCPAAWPACTRPSGWCSGSGAVYKNMDCDGDGLLDHWCDTGVSRGGLLSSNNCTASSSSTSWPSASIDACPAAYTCGTFSNIAAMGTATQTLPSFNGGAPDRGIDGNTNGAYSAGSVTQTAFVAEPWWRVTFASKVTIRHVAIWPRTDCCQSRLSAFNVSIYQDATLVYRLYIADTITAARTVTLPMPVTATAVELRLVGTARTDPLSVAEVQVFACAMCTTLQNLALGGSATQSSTNYGASASRANDGNTNGVFNAGSVTHTLTTSEPNPSWKVTLYSAATISQIIIWPRTDSCCQARLSNFTVSVFNGATTVYSQFIPDIITAARTIQLPFPITGTAVQIQLLVMGTTRSDPLSLAEVQVMGCGPTCTRPIGWCDASGQTYKNIDCDGDGVLDHWCQDSMANYGIVSSANTCKNIFPGATLGDCPAAQSSVQVVACTRPALWCSHASAVYKNVDCDGDGLVDHWCEDAAGNKGFIKSTDGCSTARWPSQSYSDCPPAKTAGSCAVRGVSLDCKLDKLTFTCTNGSTVHVEVRRALSGSGGLTYPDSRRLRIDSVTSPYVLPYDIKGADRLVVTGLTPSGSVFKVNAVCPPDFLPTPTPTPTTTPDPSITPDLGVSIPSVQFVCGSVPEGSFLTLTCPPNTFAMNILVVGFANYGVSTGSCETGFTASPSCTSSWSNMYPPISNAFDMLSVGTLQASNAVFGDPCPGSKKTLTVRLPCYFEPTNAERNPDTVSSSAALTVGATGAELAFDGDVETGSSLSGFAADYEMAIMAATTAPATPWIRAQYGLTVRAIQLRFWPRTDPGTSQQSSNIDVTLKRRGVGTVWTGFVPNITSMYYFNIQPGIDYDEVLIQKRNSGIMAVAQLEIIIAGAPMPVGIGGIPTASSLAAPTVPVGLGGALNKLNDGTADQIYVATLSQFRPWFQIDLLSIYQVMTIVYFPRYDGSYAQSSFVDISILENGVVQWSYYIGQIYSGDPVIIKVDTPFRYADTVKIQKRDTNVLSVVEVMIYATV